MFFPSAFARQNDINNLNSKRSGGIISQYLWALRHAIRHMASTLLLGVDDILHACGFVLETFWVFMFSTYWIQKFVILLDIKFVGLTASMLSRA